MSSTSSRKRFSASPEDAGRRVAAGPREQRIERSTFVRNSVCTEFHQNGQVAMASHISAWRATSSNTNTASNHPISRNDASVPWLKRSNNSRSTSPVRIGNAITTTHKAPPRRYWTDR
jgi:hypothetical protein